LAHLRAVKNTAEGINMFDGTTWQFFHDGETGEHPAWACPSPNTPRNALEHILNSIA
jgi:1,4-alpha-glucan branching enzyme